jgi:nitrate reductase gamma subunit
MLKIPNEKVKAFGIGLAATAVLAALIVIGSRNLNHFDAALVGYTFATLFAVFGITYRYAMWLQRPPTRLYWRRGWQMFLKPRFVLRNLAEFCKRFFIEFMANRFIFRRGRARWGAHWLIMWGCIIAAAITFPLVWGWVHFETTPEDINVYQTYIFGFAAQKFPVHSLFAFVVFHGLVWASFLVIGGVMLAFRRRMIDHGAAAVQQFGEDVLPLLLLFAISVTGLMLTASYTWMKGYAYDFLAILHAVTVILTLVYLPFGKFFHIFQRPAQLGVSFYKDVDARTQQATCARCGSEFMSMIWQNDLAQVERDLGFDYRITAQEGAEHYQQVCPRCRRALFGLAQGALWRAHLTDRARQTTTESHE